jgi:hypothetical protein
MHLDPMMGEDVKKRSSTPEMTSAVAVAAPNQ